MKRSLFFLILIISGGLALGQITNKAYIKINPGAFVVCGSFFTNDAGGSVQNNGDLYVSGNFVNNASFASGSVSSVSLNGAAQDIGGTSSTVFNNLIITGTGNKTISVHSSVADSLVLNANKILISNYNLSLLPNANVINADNSRFVVTNGTGSLIKKSLPTATGFLFPVGDTLNSYKPAILNYTGTTDTFAVRVEKGVNPTTGSDPTCVQKTWVINENVTGGTTASLNLGWNTQDQGTSFVNSAALIWHNVGGTWSPVSGIPGSVNNLPATDWYHLSTGITNFSSSASRFIVRTYPPPVIVKHPGPAIACVGGSMIFNLFATGMGLTYQWQENCGSGWQNLSNNGTYSGTTTNTLTISGVTLLINGCQYQCIVTNEGGSVTTNAATATVNVIPVAEAGPNVTYSGTPVQIGNSGNGPGVITWIPSAGLNDTTLAQPLASPTVTTTYTLSVNNSGCTATDVVTVTVTGIGYNISGKTRYLGKANNGTPAPNPPTYNSVIYNIDNVIVILKNYPSGTEVARDTSDALGVYQFTNVTNGTYILSYDKYTVDTMQWGNAVDAIDVAIMKYYIGCDTTIDPSRNFYPKYRKAANVDNNTSINAIDISRTKAKIGAPYNVTKNFPKGNWVALDTSVTVAGGNLNITLKTICYGDYNASSSKYRDSLVNWGMAKSLPENIIAVSDEYITTGTPDYFEIPLRISTKMNDFSALGLELNYPVETFSLVSASMSKGSNKNGYVKINPTLEEIIAEDNDLLVTDEDGVIRVVFATTDHFDVAANDEIIRLGFRSHRGSVQGALDFELSGTGVMGDQYGQENEDAYLLMPRVFVLGNNTEPGFEFTGYPNPFGGDAILTYRIPADGMVKIDVYNAIGELVQELINETRNGGRHEVVFSPGSLPAGMYTFRLEFTGTDKTQNKTIRLIH